jgi:hypothetical protein
MHKRADGNKTKAESETQHWITKTENAKVTLQNMYIGFEETDNSGVFIKIL